MYEIVIALVSISLMLWFSYSIGHLNGRHKVIQDLTHKAVTMDQLDLISAWIDEQ